METKSKGRAGGPAEATAAESDAFRLFVTLARAAAAVARRSELDVARHGLTPAEFGVLEVLYHRGPLLLGEVQRKILSSSGGVTYLVDRLEVRGLVERQACPGDRRARYAVLTADGEALIRRILPAHVEVIAQAVSGLSAAEQRTAAKLLRKLGVAAGAAFDDGESELS